MFTTPINNMRNPKAANKVSPGFGMENGTPYLCWGNHIIFNQNQELHNTSSGSRYTIKTEPSKINYEIFKKFFQLIPQATPLIVMAALFSAAKPLFANMGLMPNMVFALVAPSGHLKTSIIKKYCLETLYPDAQILRFASRLNLEKLERQTQELVGLSILVDDIHSQHSTYAKNALADKFDRTVHFGYDLIDSATMFITAESLSNLGIFSCRDRIFEIHIPKMSGEELQKCKSNFSQLNIGHWNSIKKKFLQALINNYDNLKTVCSNFLNQTNSHSSNYDYSTRMPHHNNLIRLVNYLVWKYLFPENEADKNIFSQNIEDLLELNRKYQERELSSLNNNNYDYVLEFSNMIQSDNLRKGEFLTNKNSDTEYYDINETIYLTSQAICNGMSNYLNKYVSYKDVVKELDAAGMLTRDRENKRSVHIPKIGKRGYGINKSLLSKYSDFKQNTVLGDIQ